MAKAYPTALEVISDTAAELGLGVVQDAYGSSDPNIVQLRGLLKTAGRKLIFERDWTHLVREYQFTTVPRWANSTTYSTAADLNTWFPGDSQTLTGLNQVTNVGNIYRVVAITTGLTSLTGLGPSGQGQSIVDGGVTWAYQCSGIANVVANGLYMYRCTNALGVSSATSDGPNGSVLGGTETDGTVTWVNIGLASEYALPDGFSNIIDQTGWNRTTRLPLGGPVSAQVWQYLKGRQQGVVFNVLFRPDDDTIKLYPDTNPPGGQNIAFEYTSRFWVADANTTDPIDDEPDDNNDVILFDPLLVTRRLRLDWLGSKGFDTGEARRDYDQTLEVVKNADGTAPILNLRGPGQFDPLMGGQNVPITGFGQ